MDHNIPDPSVRRLSAYLRQLERLAGEGTRHVSSRQLAGYIKAGDAQVRRDLALFGQFGRRGVGYEVDDLINVLRTILGTRQRQWPVVVVGAGEICHALLTYRGFRQRGFDVVAAFDIDPKKIGRTIGGVDVLPMEDCAPVIQRLEVRLAILAVPADAADETARRLCECGIEGILNFATTGLEVPEGVFVSEADITSHLEQLSFRLTSHRP
ncbi:MAG: redox-sensing transcriptional repressor Rex [Planctomycetes bacterium]|jgi:redox-sensing transcriptional repressor|nr:redox-sensing transcriptional repressor Rex [Phycisphaerae bacterium]NBB95593.1 redox-sensing transcriptional repressor Rex [Planctomycetota bacterium]